MAVSIMSACCRASALGLYLFSCFLQVLTQGEVFQVPRTHNVFLRSKRANNFLVEEIFQGNLERECHEELCNLEEAREYFEDDKMTEIFWSGYYGNKCNPNPCQHGGNCTSIGSTFHCACVPPHHGRTCEHGPRRGSTASRTIRPESVPLSFSPTEYSECPTAGPTACHQLCEASRNTFICSCLPGFKLQSDKRSCQPEAEFPCGKLPENFLQSQCDHGNFPWQVLVVNSRRVELCGGVLVGPSSVLTAARCLHQESDIQPHNFYVVPGNEKRYLPVGALNIHEKFHPDRHDYDLALLELSQPLTFSPTLIHLCLPPKDFSENILMRPDKVGLSKSQGPPRIQRLSYQKLDDCRVKMNISHRMSNKMFCMRRNTAIRTCNGSAGKQTAESLDRNLTIARRCGHPLPGTPVATVDRETAFLTGLLTSSSRDCEGLVFTKLSRYLTWIKPQLEPNSTHSGSQIKLFPDFG